MKAQLYNLISIKIYQKKNIMLAKQKMIYYNKAISLEQCHINKVKKIKNKII